MCIILYPIGVISWQNSWDANGGILHFITTFVVRSPESKAFSMSVSFVDSTDHTVMDPCKHRHHKDKLATQTQNKRCCHVPRNKSVSEMNILQFAYHMLAKHRFRLQSIVFFFLIFIIYPNKIYDIHINHQPSAELI